MSAPEHDPERCVRSAEGARRIYAEFLGMGG